MIWTCALLLAAAAVIYGACEFFVNGVEWLGRELKLTQTATGSVLAAFGTALPESAITFVAVVFGNSPSSKDIGVGAAIGGPLALSTVAYAVVGLALLAVARRIHAARHRPKPARPGVVEADTRRLRRDQLWFLGIFAVKIALGLVAFSFKPALGVAFLAAYAVYCRRELMAEHDATAENTDPEPLKLRPHTARPGLAWVLIQTGLSLAVIFAASHFFVGGIGTLGPQLGLAPQLAALLISPVATELPEIMNAVIWVRQGKERLALANISGAMMIQATIPTALGLFFSPWRLSPPSLLAALTTALAIVWLQWSFSKPVVRAARLTAVIWLYAVFAVLLAML